MLDQVIYTRCMPHRDLINKGAVSRSDGFGVFSMSQSIFDPEKQIDLGGLKRQLAKKNGAKEKDAVGLISSYEYFAVSDTKYALTYEVPRPFLQDARGSYSNRADNFIKQGLVGALKGYPCEYFGANCWDAYKKGENEYYIESDPAWLCQISDVAAGGTVSKNRVRTFVQDGRADAVKTAVWFLMEEYSKPVGERKVLLIRDYPANVELWVAAIEYAFSAAMARQITFTTNRTNLNGQTETALFYYTDAAGKFYPNRVGGSSLTRTPFCMIVGFHPQDRYCTNVRQQAASSFVILDGAAKTLNIPVDNSIQAPYFSAVVQYDADIEDFCGILLPSLPLKQITKDLPKLFDAYKYLLDSSHNSEKWGYASTVQHLNCLTAFGLPCNDALNKYLLDECIRAYGKFAEQDENGKYPLLKIMWRIAGALHREQEVAGCVADRLAEALTQLGSRGDMLCRSWRAAENGGVFNMLRSFLREMFADSELQRYSSQFRNCRVETIGTVADMYLQMLTNEPGGMSIIMDKEARFMFIRDMLANMVDDRWAAKELLGKLNRVENLVNAQAVAVAEYLDSQNSRQTDQWWDIIVEVSGGTVLELCKRLCSYSKAKIELVEKLLSNHILQNRKCDWEVQDIFKRAATKFGLKNDTGLVFFRSWIKVMKNTDISSIIFAARQMNLSKSVAREIFSLLDNAVGYDIMERPFEKVARDLDEWGRELGVASRTLAFGKLCRALDRARDADDVIDTVREFGEKQYSVDDEFVDSEYFARIVRKTSELESEELTLELLLAFRFESSQAHQDFVDEYVQIAMSPLRGPAKIRQMVVLTGAMILRISRKSARSTAVNAVQDYLEASLKANLPKYTRSGDMERIEKHECDKDVREELLELLKSSGWNNNSGNRLNDLFGGISAGINDLFRKGKK